MSAEIVNLRRARKEAARDRHDAAASANRARHGRTKGERALQQLEAERAARTLDGSRRERDAPPADAG